MTLFIQQDLSFLSFVVVVFSTAVHTSPLSMTDISWCHQPCIL